MQKITPFLWFEKGRERRKRLFAEGTCPEGFKLIASKATPAGVIIASYEPAGAIKSGSFV